MKEILTLCRKPTKQWKIARFCRLCYPRMVKHLDALIEKGLLKVLMNPSRLYVTTDKGLKFLETIEDPLISSVVKG